MRSAWAPLVLAALASLAEACGGHHKHEDRVWTAEEVAELEYKWGMEVSGREAFLLFTPFDKKPHSKSQACGHDLAGHASCLSCGRPKNIISRHSREIDLWRSPPM